MDRLDAMTVLLAAVDAGSLSGAARAIDRPLSTVSRLVGDLEGHLGARLLVRTSRRLELTEAGQGYVEAARRILGDVAETERAAAGEYAEPRGELVVTAPLVFGRLHVLPVITDFLAVWPDIDVRLVQSDRVLHLLDEHVDVALRIGALPDSDLVASGVGHVRRVVCASPDYLAEHGVPERPEALARHRCITFDTLDRGVGWSFGEGNAQRRISLRSRLLVNTAEAAVDAAVAGTGLTRVLSYQVAAAVADGRLRIVLADDEPRSLPVSLVCGPHGLRPIKVRAFLNFARPRLAAALDTVRDA